MSGTRTLVPGRAEGAPTRLDEALSFWGGFDSADGRIIDRFHPQHGACLAGRILFVARGRGSSSGASVLAEALRLGTAPRGICLLHDDAIITTGALVAAILYRIACPVVVLDTPEQWEDLAARPHVVIEASETGGVRFL